MSNSEALFSFAVIADTHLNPQNTPNTSPWRTNRLANDRTRAVVDVLNKLQPAFVVHLGDVVHPVPTHPDYGPAAETAREILGRLAYPLHILPGNHDIGDKPLDWMPADCISTENVLRFRETFGADWGAFDHGGCRFVRINSSLLNSQLPLEAEQKRWLEAQLAASKSKRIFLFTHYPPYVTRADEASHYDNLDEPGRSWLCRLLVEHRVEAVFAGHVHNFFYNRHRSTDCYVLPSVTNLRQDYAEFFHVEPADEYGRNDTPKIGFFVVDVYRDRHVARFMRTNGATDATPPAEGRNPIERPVPSAVGVYLRHAWAEEIELPYNAPLDELSRKRVRNDYGVLAMWDLGVNKVRVPFSDLADDRIRARMRDLHALGQRFTVFSFGLPDRATLDVINAHRSIVDRWEMVLPLHALGAACHRLRGAKSLELPPISLSKLRSHGDANHDPSKPFDHAVSLGFDVAECEDAGRLWKREGCDVFDGLLFKIDVDQPIIASVSRISDISAEFRFRASICAKLAPLRSADAPQSDHAIANRVAEVVLCAWSNPRVEIFLDTFQDVDRGYYLRPGLIDRRCNPRLAGHVLRELQWRLRDLAHQGALRESNGKEGRTIAFQSGECRCVLALPQSPQDVGTRLGGCSPLITPATAKGAIPGPWLEICST